MGLEAINQPEILFNVSPQCLTTIMSLPVSHLYNVSLPSVSVSVQCSKGSSEDSCLVKSGEVYYWESLGVK